MAAATAAGVIPGGEVRASREAAKLVQLGVAADADSPASRVPVERYEFEDRLSELQDDARETRRRDPPSARRSLCGHCPRRAAISAMRRLFSGEARDGVVPPDPGGPRSPCAIRDSRLVRAKSVFAVESFGHIPCERRPATRDLEEKAAWFGTSQQNMLRKQVLHDLRFRGRGADQLAGEPDFGHSTNLDGRRLLLARDPYPGGVRLRNHCGPLALGSIRRPRR